MRVVMFVNPRGKKVKTDTSALLTFEVMAEMWRAGRKPFDHCVLGDHPVEALKQFWDDMAGEDIAPHPVNADPYWEGKQDRTLGMYVHADGVQIYTHCTYTVFSCSSAQTCDNISYDQQLLLLVVQSSAICVELSCS